MRVLFTSWPAWGHLYAMYPLARAAQEAGHEVAVASGADVTTRLDEDGFRTWAVGPTREAAVAVRGVADRPSRSAPLHERVEADIREMFAPAGERRAEELLPLAREWKPDVVIHGAGDASGAAVAAVLQIPSVLHGLSLALPGFETLLEPLLSAVAEPFGIEDLAHRVLHRTMLDLTPPSLLPATYLDSPFRQPLQPFEGELDLNPDVARSIAELPRSRTVYLTFGTIVNNAPGLMETALGGILECDVNVVVTTGPGFEGSRLGPLPARVLVREHIGQATALARCQAVISHAGAGTMLGGLTFGLPQMALPLAADQPFNAATLERVGAGIRLDPAGLTASAVGDAVSMLLDEPSYRSSAGRLQGEIGQMPTAAQVWQVLERRLTTGC